ncbi:CLUMA_CG011972, isoform A [Clunio marinus]|uniref:CLUMA_CG011972, isoform A n=1 Tax=Clunio marinus TaxID=568069 RepID=A0A1J1IHN3_9DIPT|nr:CLUMA_CG011972, isoform A [Clunio marinus]
MDQSNIEEKRAQEEKTAVDEEIETQESSGLGTQKSSVLETQEVPDENMEQQENDSFESDIEYGSDIEENSELNCDKDESEEHLDKFTENANISNLKTGSELQSDFLMSPMPTTSYKMKNEDDLIRSIFSPSIDARNPKNSISHLEILPTEEEIIQDTPQVTKSRKRKNEGEPSSIPKASVKKGKLPISSELSCEPVTMPIAKALKKPTKRKPKKKKNKSNVSMKAKPKAKIGKRKPAKKTKEPVRRSTRIAEQNKLKEAQNLISQTKNMNEKLKNRRRSKKPPPKSKSKLASK